MALFFKVWRGRYGPSRSFADALDSWAGYSVIATTVLLVILFVAVGLTFPRDGTHFRPLKRVERPRSRRPYEVVYEAARETRNRAGAGALTPVELTCESCWLLYSYIEGDGPEGGVSNMGASKARAAAPALVQIGLARCATLLNEFLDQYEEFDRFPHSEEGDRQFLETSDLYAEELRQAGFDELPDRLDAYLEKNYPWL
ncbi:MAG: hypothetical protein GVY31_04100 [Alphaproteobacteria bacterium]|nr:hypothetical protein [Alphaproteobacteria bacterium]